MAQLSLVVRSAEDLTANVRRLRLAGADGAALPKFTAGAHIKVKVKLPDGRADERAYSLVNSDEQNGEYEIAVQREASGKGGSVYMHTLAVGDNITASEPVNDFPLESGAARHVLIAGGIGITPFMSQLHELHNRGDSYELHYAFRAEGHGAFQDELAQSCPGRVRFYDSSNGQTMNVASLLRDLKPDAHVYMCGPGTLIDAVHRAAQGAGVAPWRVHVEKFAAAKPSGAAFTLVLAKSGVTVEVASGESILDAIERDGTAPVDCLCREGVCGTCETRILEGEAVHFDQYLTDKDKAAQQTLLICVSRAKGEKLVLDL